MLPTLLTLSLAVGADPQQLPTLPKVEMPKLVDGIAPLKPLSSQTPFVLPLPPPLASSQPPLNIPSLPRPSIGAAATVPTRAALNEIANINTPMIPNGCGSPASFIKPWPILQAPLGFDFSKACDAHDICYGTLWADKAACDDKFALDMYRSCLTARERAQAIPMCFGLANVYYGAVRFGGEGAFQQAQLEALRPTHSGPSLFAPPDVSFTDKFGLLPKTEAPPKYRLTDLNLTK